MVYKENGGTVPLIFISALDRGEWSALHSGRFKTWGSASSTHWTGGWVCPTDGLNFLEKIKISWPGPDSNRGWSSLVAQSLYRLLFQRKNGVQNVLSSTRHYRL
jgi:hypothetical protein